MDDPGWPEALIVFVSLALTSLLARIGSVSAALSRSTLERLSEEDVSRASLYLKLYRPREVTGQLVIFGQAVAVAIGALGCTRLVAPHFLGSSWPYLIQFLMIGFFVLVSLLVGNLVPSYRREENSDRPLPLLPIILYPIHLMLLVPTLILQKAQNPFASEDDSKALKEEELRMIVESQTEEGTLEAEEREMIEGIFDLDETLVKEIMVPRIDMVCVEISSPPEDLLKLIHDSRHSRIPIYEERIDHVKGVVYAKDLLHVMSSGQEWTIGEIMRPPLFVPETKNIGELMAELKNEKVHIAIVVGEYGGTSGLVSMEDILEEIVGEIQDEYDEELPLYHWRVEGQILMVDARIPIEDLNPILNTELPQDGFETLGGFIYNHLGHVPDPEEAFEYENLIMTIQEIEGQRIANVLIEKQESSESAAPQNAEIA